ncbi:hypothetical protein T552_03507 [Pneumocystis carinii B80]|uniref:Uncharacterized protein n=1 Tax=Pneumocystis carinii (strain B80) TaxID=1408658 RepID=A0A0W4ZB62_PNEC8|nr:hypothetical protein T552_03507 [Pneumocystis carinii B80]KTW25647.1 hypothetical protein T552_03507 [Pneumocystis carinii B80]
MKYNGELEGFSKKNALKRVKMREKRGNKEVEKEGEGSYLFRPYRRIGYVSDKVPFDIMKRGRSFLVSLSVGESIQTYDCNKLNLLFITPSTKGRITCVCSWGDFILAGAGEKIYAYCKGKIEWSIKQEEEERVVLMSVLGGYLVTYTEKNHLIIWNVHSREMYSKIEFDRGEEVLCMLHPATYLNKFIFGKKDGTVEIWNIRTGKRIYEFSSFKISVTCLEQAPVLDVIAIGLANGVIYMYNIKKDKELFQFKQDGNVTSISFRTDGPSIMCSSNNKGDIFIWDLFKKRILNILYTAHFGSIARIKFLEGQPILLSSGIDNSLKEWIFDSPDSTPRLLKHRSGHSAPPSIIRFYQNDSHFILSTSRDRSLRGFSVFNDSQNTELSQKPFIKKPISLKFSLEELRLPEILSFAVQPTKEKYWNNIITAHKGENVARLWSWRRKAIEKFVLTTSDKSSIKSVAISVCGNFGFVGSSLGTIDMYNMQSRLHRRKFHDNLDGHRKEITGIVSDSLNKTLVSSSLDGTIKFWKISTGKLIYTLDMKLPITLMRYQKSSDLLAIACDDFCIRVIDIETTKVVRELWGHTNRITDLVFSYDGRWIISSSLDSTIRTWDLPVGCLIDAFRTPSICTSLDFSPTGDFLATTHVDNFGITLWTNKSQFSEVFIHSIQESDIKTINLPAVSGENGSGIIDLSLKDVSSETDILCKTEYTSSKQINQMLTLSSVPRFKLNILHNIDIIKLRNKPKEPPKAPKNAPFFLPLLKDTSKDIIPSISYTNESSEIDKGFSRIISTKDLSVESQFTKLLKQGAAQKDYMKFMNHLKTLNPSSIDFEIQSLSPDSLFSEIIWFLDALTQSLKKQIDFEFIQICMAKFLNIHGDIFIENPNNDALQQSLINWEKEHKIINIKLKKLVDYCSGVLSFIRS